MNETRVNNNDYLSKLNRYNLSLYARVIEGNYEKRPVISMNCNTKNYFALYNIGKELYNIGDISKYEIAVFFEGKYILGIRPDKYNFQKNFLENDFEKQVYEEIIYRENNNLTKTEQCYDKLHDTLWNSAFKELLIDLEKENYIQGEKLENYLFSCLSNSNKETQDNLTNEPDEDIELEM